MEIRTLIRKLPGIGRLIGEKRGKDSIGLRYKGSRNGANRLAMQLSAVYACVDITSKSVAQLPLEIYTIDEHGKRCRDRGNPLYPLLYKKPNGRMTRYTLVELWVQSLHLNGNAYAYIKRGHGGGVEALVYVPAGYVTVNTPTSIFEEISYTVNGIGLVPAKDMIHIVNKSYDGVTGVSTIRYAANTIGLAQDSEEHAANFFSSGCGIGGILKSNQHLTTEKAQEAKDAWKKAVEGSGPNGVVVIGLDLDFRAMTVNPADAQLLETRQFNVVEICRFFGVSPVKVHDLSKSSYSTVEATNISFLTDTISPLLEKIELELETKLFPGRTDVDIRFDIGQLLRADKQSLARYYSTLFQIGAITPNEIRSEIDLNPVEGGDTNYVQVNLAPLGSHGDNEKESKKTA